MSCQKFKRKYPSLTTISGSYSLKRWLFLPQMSFFGWDNAVKPFRCNIKSVIRRFCGVGFHASQKESKEQQKPSDSSAFTRQLIMLRASRSRPFLNEYNWSIMSLMVHIQLFGIADSSIRGTTSWLSPTRFWHSRQIESSPKNMFNSILCGLAKVAIFCL